MNSLIPFITMLVLMNRQVVVVDSQPTTINDGGREGQCSSPDDQFLVEIIVEMRREMREMQRQSEDRLRAELVELRNVTDRQRQLCDAQFSESVRRDELEQMERGMVERDRIIADLTNQLEELSDRLEIVEGRQPMESCRWPASRGLPRLSSGIVLNSL